MRIHIQVISFAWLFAGLFLLACDSTTPSEPPLVLEVALPNDAGPALSFAAEDLASAAIAISGGRGPANVSVTVTIDPELPGADDESYRLTTRALGLSLVARSEVGAAYGLYHVAADLGARYIHPEQSVFPSNPRVTLPVYNGELHAPAFRWRGFHEHTQHPIVMSDFLLRPGRDDFRAYVSNYLRWLLRNRQNSLSFHMLNTIDLDQWVPYMTDIVIEAQSLGVDVGAFVGFVDQQQNAFRLVKPTEEGTAEMQIASKLDRILETGLNSIGFQISTSEFTKPDEEEMLGWLNFAAQHLTTRHPDVRPYIWIHITCGLEREAGGPYYHLPLDSDSALGAFVHTTMFYTLEHPAPVYDCQNFQHQRPFFDAADGQRALVFFPETAWWLGFDNNVPLVNPITGKSREYDIREELPNWDVEGHVTFTTGREWTYWQYDHYLTRVTWDGVTTWADYLRWLAPIYGEYGLTVSDILERWTSQQWHDLYVTHPEIYFYLSGELPQDELGEQAGIIARPPKVAFREVYDMADDAFTAWANQDLQMLKTMRDTYQLLLDELPDGDGSPLYVELRRAYGLFVHRIRHSIALYEGVSAVRIGDREVAQQKLLDAEKLGSQAVETVAAQEALYRYPAEVLVALKPESLTAYPFGYLNEASTGYFWTRREEQLAQLIRDVFEAPPEDWIEPPIEVFEARGSEVAVLFPMNAVLQTALGGFIPRLLVNITSSASTMGEVSFELAQDYNENGRPDAETVTQLLGEPESNEEVPTWAASADLYAVTVRDGGGSPIGRLEIESVVVKLAQSAEGTFDTLTLDGQVADGNILDLVTSVAGIERDALSQLIKSIWALPLDEELPELLPMRIQFPLHSSAD